MLIHPNKEAAEKARSAYLNAIGELSKITGAWDEIHDGDGVILTKTRYYDENGNIQYYWE